MQATPINHQTMVATAMGHGGLGGADAWPSRMRALPQYSRGGGGSNGSERGYSRVMKSVGKCTPHLVVGSSALG